MNSSPISGRPRVPADQPESFNSPNPARRLFANTTTPRPNSTTHQTNDLLSASTPPQQRYGTPGHPNTVQRVAVVKIDHSNETLRSDLNAVRYELQTLREERALEGIRHEQEIRAAEAAAEDAAKRADEAESEKRFLFEKQEELAKRLQEVKDEAAEEKAGLEKALRGARGEIAALKEAVAEGGEEMRSAERRWVREKGELETRLTGLVAENRDLKEVVGARLRTMEEVQAKLEAKDAEVQELEVELLRVKATTGDLETLKVLKRELAEQVGHIKTLESTNRRQLSELKTLRETNRSLELVEEEKRTLEGKVKVLDELRDELSSAQLRISVLQDERGAWESYFQSEGLEFDSPQSLAKALIEERVEKVALLEQAGRANPELQEKERLVSELEGEVRLLREELEKSKETSSKDSRARQRMERQKALALKEAQFLREQLKSFQTEESVFNNGNFDEQQKARIQELEGLLESYKNEIEELKAAAASAAVSSNGIEAAATKKRALDENAGDERFGELTRRNRQLQDDVSRLQQRETILNKEIAALQIRISSMENTSTRILQLKDNPTAREQAVKVSQLKALREENAALLAQIEGRIEEEHVRMVPHATLENVRAEVKAMENVVAEKEKRITRLRQIFSAKSLEFKQAVYELLGWKLDFMPNGRVKVTHMFGDEKQSIEFDGEQGTMKVTGGPNSAFGKEIRNQCVFWMARKSIPCLLASILIEQYEKTTRAQI